MVKNEILLFERYLLIFCSYIKLESLGSYDQIDAYRILSYKELRDCINDQIRTINYEEICGDNERLGRILLRLPSLAEIDINIIEEIFFVGLIGKFLFFFS